MTRRTKRISFYLTLALVCYGLAVIVGKDIAIGVLIGVGAIGELLFWKALIWG